MVRKNHMEKIKAMTPNIVRMMRKFLPNLMLFWIIEFHQLTSARPYFSPIGHVKMNFSSSTSRHVNRLIGIVFDQIAKPWIVSKNHDMIMHIVDAVHLLSELFERREV